MIAEDAVEMNQEGVIREYLCANEELTPDVKKKFEHRLLEPAFKSAVIDSLQQVSVHIGRAAFDEEAQYLQNQALLIFDSANDDPLVRQMRKFFLRHWEQVFLEAEVTETGGGEVVYVNRLLEAQILRAQQRIDETLRSIA